MSNIKEINDRYGASFHRGQRVFCDGRWGVVVGATHSHVRVRFDGRTFGAPCDPCELLSDLKNLAVENPIIAIQESTAHPPPAGVTEHLELRVRRSPDLPRW